MADDMGLNVQLAMESQSFQQQITTINRQMTVARAEFGNASTAVDGFGDATQSLEAKAGNLTRQIAMSQQKVDLLTTAHERARTILATNAQANEVLRQQVANTTSAYDASVIATGANSEESVRLRTELASLNTQFTQSNTIVNRNSATVDNLNIRLQNTQRIQNGLQSDLNATNTDLENQTNGLNDVGVSAEENQEKMKVLGEKITEMGKVAVVGILAIGTAMVGTVALGVNMGTDLTKALNGVQSSVGYSDKQMGGMHDTMIAIYNDNFGADFEDIGKSIEEVGRQTGLTGKALQLMTENALLLKDTFGFEVTDSIRSVSQMMKQFGLSSDEAFNLITQGTQNGIDASGDFLDTINEYSGTFKQQGFTASEFFNMLSNGNKAGVRDTDLLADAIKEFGIRSKDASDGTAKGFTALGLNAVEMTSAFTKGGETGQVAFEKVTKALLGMKDPVAQNSAGIALFGTQYEDLGLKGVTALLNTKGAINDNVNALGKINEVKYNDFASGMEGIKRQLQTGLLLPLGEEVLPKLNEFGNYLKTNLPAIIEDLKPVINGFVDSFKFLGENLNVVAPLLVTVVGGIGAFKAVSAVTGIVSAFSAVMGTTAVATAGVGVAGVGVATGMGAVGLAVGGAAVAAAPFILTGAAIVGTGILIKNSMDKEVVPSINLFADKVTTTSTSVSGNYATMSAGVTTETVKISKATATAVGAYMKMDEDASKSLSNLYVNSTVITDKTALALETKYKEMATNIKIGLDTHYTEQLTTMQTFFSKSSALTTEDELQILANMKSVNEGKKGLEDFHAKEILAIIKKAKDEHRELTSKEQVDINEIQNKMKINAVKALSDGEVESKVILERLKEYTTRITTEQASEEIKNANKARDGSVTAAKDKYNKVVAEIVRQRDEAHTITADQADKLIANAQLEKDGVILRAEELRTGVVEKITSMNSDVINNVNTSSGDILTQWDKLKSWWDNWIPAVKTFFTQTISSGGTGGLGDNSGGNYKFAVGTRYLPKDMIIEAHEGEMIVPKSENPYANSGGGKTLPNNGITQTVNIYSPTALSPSETARQNKRALQELAFSF